MNVFVFNSLKGKRFNLLATNLTLFETQPQHSYLCTSLLKTNLTSSQTHQSPFQSGILETSDLKVQAFMPIDEKIYKFYPSKFK